MNKKKIFKIFINYLLPIFAILISIVSLYYSCESNKISRANLELNYSPIIDVDFKIDNFKKNYSLTIFNDGPSSVFEVRIKSLSRLYHKDTKQVGVSINTKKKWKFINELEANRKEEFSIKYEELENAFNLIHVVNPDSIDFVLPAQLYYITFRRLPDRSIYKNKKYLFLYPNYNKKLKTSFIAIDPEKQFWEENRDIRRQLEIYDNEIL